MTLQSQLSVVDAACERNARAEIDAFYETVAYTGSRIICPAFAEVASVWLRLIERREEQLIAETIRILDATVAVDEESLHEIQAFIEGVFEDSDYRDRLKIFSEGVARTVSRYGLSFNASTYRFDLADAAYRAGLSNMLRAARVKFDSELSTYISQRGSKMRLSALLTDTVSLLKKDGQRFEGIKASVQSEKIFVSGADYLVESGDLIQRKMSNGGEETFEVIDPGFHEKFHSIPAGYQMTVKKLGIPEARAAVQNVTYNIAGNNARINQNSVDNSVNVVKVNPDAIEYINALRSAITGAAISSADRQTAIEVIDVVETQFQSGRPSKTVVSTLLASLPHLANITAIVSSILSLF
jgi:hypothetical protein